MAPPNEKKPSPPEGLSWGDGELRVPKRQPGPSSDVKGVFTESVIAQMPVSDLALEEEPAAQPFANLEPKAGQWREPGADPSRARGTNSLRARSSPVSASVLEVAVRAAARPIEISNAGAPGAPAPAAAFAAPSEPFGTRPAAPAPARDLPAGALTAPGPAASRAMSGPVEPRVAARARAVSADVAPLAEAQGTRTLEFEPSPAGSGLELDAPAAPRASSIQPRQMREGTGASIPGFTAPSRDPKPAAKPEPSLRPASTAPSNSMAPAAVAAQQAKSKPPAEDEEEAVERSPSGRPLAKQKRAEARRAARRAAAKHLPPPPSPLIRGWDPARITLAAFTGIVALSALVIGAAAGGMITLPPAAAAMLGLDSAHASLSRTGPRGDAPNLVMPSAPAQPPAAPAAAVVRVAPPQAAAPEPGPQPAPPEPDPQPSAAAPAPSAVVAVAPTVAPAQPTPPPAAAAVEAPAAPAPAVAPPEPETPPTPRAAAAEPAPSVEPEKSASEPEESADDARLVRVARGLLARDPPGAAEMMMKLIARSPDDHHAMEVLVRAWIAMGRGKDAVGYAELIVKKRPKRAIYRLLQGDAKQLTGDRAGAEAAWRAVLALEPNDPDAKRRLGL